MCLHHTLGVLEQERLLYFSQNTEDVVFCKTAALLIQRQAKLNDLRQEFEDLSELERADEI